MIQAGLAPEYYLSFTRRVKRWFGKTGKNWVKQTGSHKIKRFYPLDEKGFTH